MYKKKYANYTKEDLIIELERLKYGTTTQNIFAFLKYLVVSLSVVAIVYCIYLSVAALSGMDTDANIAINFMAKIEALVAWGVGAGGAVYGWSQRNFRKKRTEELQERIIELEKQIDGNRTSSEMPKDGCTREDDK